MSNPYESPEASGPWPPRLTRGQRKALAFVFEHRGRKLRWRDVLRFVAPMWGVVLLIFGAIFAGGLAMSVIDQEIVSDVMLGIMGVMIGWFGWQVVVISQLVQIWPLVDRAVDWEQVEQTLTGS